MFWSSGSAVSASAFSRPAILFRRLSVAISLLSSIILLLSVASCGGSKGKEPPPANIGGGFTLLASGGTFNDGPGLNGLAVLVTLRDSKGNGPGASAGWKVSITGPGINSPLVVSYEDGSPSSYSAWWWESLNPQSGTYTANASNGSTSLTYKFNIDVSKVLSQPSLNKAGITVTWNALSGADSYHYRVMDGTGFELLSGYHAADPHYSSYLFNLPVLSEGSYLVEVFAHTTNRVTLQNDTSASPSLAAQENISLASLDIVAGGSGSGYTLDARGGALYEGSTYSAGTGTVDYYGLVMWTSILTDTAIPSTPASAWDISVTGPGITAPITFTYPATNSHYAYWDFGTVPETGTYTVSAVVSGGTTSISQTFTIPSPTAKLPLSTGLTATPTAGGGATVSWNSANGANSYYINIWTDVNGVYCEIAGNWVSSASAVIPAGTLIPGTVYDVYVTASTVDMTGTSAIPPPAPGSQVDMSDTTFTYETFTAF